VAQGYVASVSSDGNSFVVTDNSGPPLTVCYRGGAGERTVGEYVLVVGKLGLKKTSRKDDSKTESVVLLFKLQYNDYAGLHYLRLQN
jgi:hypothetical protein